MLDRAYELGATHWDSSDAYMDNEELIGKWFARTGKRKEVRVGGAASALCRVPPLSSVVLPGWPGGYAAFTILLEMFRCVAC